MKLQLAATGNNWDRFKQRKRNKKFMEIRNKILDRDEMTCQFCYFKSQSLEVLNADGNYGNNVDKNLVAACSLCAKSTLLDSYDIDYEGKDKIVYLPELTQEKLNQLTRLLVCHMHGADGDSIYNAKMIMAQLADRAIWLDECSNTKLSHPAMFSQYMNSARADKKLVSQLRWLPDPESFAQELNDWQSVLF